MGTQMLMDKDQGGTSCLVSLIGNVNQKVKKIMGVDIWSCLCKRLD